MLWSVLLAVLTGLAADTVRLRVIGTNDLHGALDSKVYPWSGGRLVGGAAVLKAWADSAERECGCLTLRFDGGDQMQGTLLSNLAFGRSTVEFFNQMGLDAAAVGNHDLDWTIDTLQARQAEARYPWLAANIVDSVTGERVPWVAPYRILERGGLRIAVIGYITPSAKRIIKASNVPGVAFTGGRAALADVLAEVRAHRPDLTVIVAHAGAFCDLLGCRGEIVDLARQLDSTEVQLIVAGHTHADVSTVVHGIPIMEVRNGGTAFGVADVVREDGGPWRVTTRVVVAYADRVTPDREVQAMLDRYRGPIEALARRPVAVLRDSLLRRGAQHPLGAILAEAGRTAAHADIGLMNNGGVRSDLPAGPVSYSQVFEVQPFQNRIMRIELTGRALRQLVEQTLERGRPNAHFAGIEIRYDPGRRFGRRVVGITGPDGSPLDPDWVYSLSAPDFLAAGGDGLYLLAKAPQADAGVTDVEALARWLEAAPQPVSWPPGKFLMIRIR